MALSGVATINTRGGHTAIWYTDCTVDLGLARLCGAWVDLDEQKTRLILAQRVLLPFPGTPIPDVNTPVEILDPNSTRAAIVDEITRLEHAHRDTRTAAGATRAPITWPAVPGELDFTHLPPALPGVNSDPLIADTIAVAHWLEELADAWASIETRRTSREHLRGEHPDPRPFPAVSTLTQSTSR